VVLLEGLLLLLLLLLDESAVTVVVVGSASRAGTLTISPVGFGFGRGA